MPDSPLFDLVEPGPVRDRLVRAVLAGQKIATCSLRAQYADRGAPLPRSGQHRALVDSDGRTVARIAITQVDVIRLADADDQLAADEGDGYRSSAHWRAGHEQFWSDHVLPGLASPTPLDDDTEIVVMRFRVAPGA